jgi:membrane associated rhomboid family serine protease
MSLQPMRRPGWNEAPPPLRFRMRLWLMTYWLILINVVVFVLDILLRGRLSDFGEFSIAKGIMHGQVWRIITFQFLHANGTHIIFNMIALYCFGPIAEPSIGKRGFLVFYLLCGCAGCAAFCGLRWIPVFGISDQSTIVGASAGIFGTIVAAAWVAPNRTVQFWLFPLPPVTLRVVTMAIAYLALAALVVITMGSNVGGEVAHLGGAAMGFLLIWNWKRMGSTITGRKRRRFWRPGDANFIRDDFLKEIDGKDK